MSSVNEIVATGQEPALISSFCSKLALPFTDWQRFVAPVPAGFTASAELDPTQGSGVLRLDAKPHPPGSPLVIGWYWAGWKRRVSVQLATSFIASVQCDQVKASGGGRWVPRCFMTLLPVRGGTTYENHIVLSPGPNPSTLVVTVPGSPNLPAAVEYELSIAFNVRAAFIGTETPQGILRARIGEVKRCFAFPTLAEGEVESDAKSEAIAAEPDGLEPRELAAVLATFDRASAE